MRDRLTPRYSGYINIPIETKKYFRKFAEPSIVPEIGMKVTVPICWAMGDGKTYAKRTGTIIKIYKHFYMVRFDTNKCVECYKY